MGEGYFSVVSKLEHYFDTVGTNGYGVNPQYGAAQGFNHAAASINASSLGPG